ncbi:MAG: protein kinase [Rhodothermales bacterium]|nr:protein kinase [Rhodothermales bacterium]
MIGSLVSHFQIEKEIGRGGMGVVYRARDVRLDRIVALKFLSNQIAHDSETRERFTREAQTAARTEHPNVCGVYDIGETEDGKPFIAMPFYEGVNLDDRGDDEPLSVAHAVSIVRQVASGLASAHVHGIVHRDIKPGNILILEDGTPKILDFGLAKMAGSQTVTEVGSTLGTFAYMSPEQVRGERLDPRTDIWSLGAVLYELVAGRRPFAGDYPEAMMYSVLNEEPATMGTYRDDVPEVLEAIAGRCLEKDRASRYQSMTELENDLAAIEAATQPAATAQYLPRQQKKGVSVWAVGAIVVLAAVTIVALLLIRRDSAEVLPPMRFTMLMPDGQELASPGPSLAISKDGSRLAFVSGDTSGSLIYVRDIDSFDALAISGTEDARAPFFSPDGEWLGFLADDKLFKVRVSGGLPQELAEARVMASFVRGSGTWLDDDRIIFSTFGPDGGLLVVPARGGSVERLTEVRHAGTAFHMWPEALPSSPYLLYTESDLTATAVSRIVALSLEDGSTRNVIENGVRPSFVPPDVLVYSTGNDVVATRFDPGQAEAIGEPVVVLTGVIAAEDVYVEYDVSEGGAIVYASQGAEQFEARLTMASLDGVLSTFPVEMADVFTPRASPDGRFVAFQRRGPGQQSLWLHDVHRRITRQLTADSTHEFWMTWTPDSRRIIFNSISPPLQLDTSVDMYEIAVDGWAEPRLISDGRFVQVPHSVTPDGQSLIYNELIDDRQLDIIARSLEGETYVETLVASEEDDFHPSISPDGEWLAFASSRTGQWEVYVQPFPGPGGVMQVSSGGGAEPVWAPDGNTLYYRLPSGRKIWAVDVSAPPIASAEPTLDLGRPRFVLEGSFFTCSKWGRSYDVTPDGEQFVVIAQDWPGAQRKMFNVVVNWATEVNQLLASVN